MSNFATFSLFPHFSTIMDLPVVRGRTYQVNQSSFSRQTLPTDAIGVFALTLSGVVVGSAIQIQAADGTPLHNETATSTTEVITLQAYAPGSPLNDLRIKVRKGSAAPFYQPFLAQALAIDGAQTIFVSQIPDE